MRMIMKNTILKAHYRIWVSQYQNDYENTILKVHYRIWVSQYENDSEKYYIKSPL